uniref:Transposase n=1 Tax=Ditylenchus dipsaci TaxID=166011 RepID=A0A915DNP7_9BILA
MKLRFSALIGRPSITADIWTDASMRNAHLGVTLNYVNYSKLQKIIFGTSQPSGFSHTGDLVLAKVEQLLHDYKLDLLKVFKVVTDNCSNMVAGSLISAIANEFYALQKTRVMKIIAMGCAFLRGSRQEHSVVHVPAEYRMLRPLTTTGAHRYI